MESVNVSTELRDAGTGLRGFSVFGAWFCASVKDPWLLIETLDSDQNNGHSERLAKLCTCALLGVFPWLPVLFWLVCVVPVWNSNLDWSNLKSALLQSWVGNRITKFIGSTAVFLTMVRTYQPIRLTRAVLPDQCSRMQWTQRMSLMRIRRNILGSMLV